MTQNDNIKQFYLNCPIGFEQLLKQEIELKYKDLKITSSKGGVLVETLLSTGLSFNIFLKIPTRVLLRLKEQKCRDLPKLYKILKKINWKEYLKQENVEFKISSQTSRLGHTGKIEKTVQDALCDYFKANQIKESKKLTEAPAQIIYLRFEDDNLTISLDSSGDRLDERKAQRFRGNASIRETYASALLLYLLENKIHDFALMDPMCGSCTFLEEAKNFWQPNLKRNFAFEHWDIEYQAPSINITSPWNIKSYSGIEFNTEVYKKIKDLEFDIKNADALKYEDHEPKIIISNPPYGKRVKISENREKYFLNMIQTYLKNYNPQIMGLIIPFDIAKKIKSKKKLTFNQNGIRVSFLVF